MCSSMYFKVKRVSILKPMWRMSAWRNWLVNARQYSCFCMIAVVDEGIVRHSDHGDRKTQMESTKLSREPPSVRALASIQPQCAELTIVLERIFGHIHFGKRGPHKYYAIYHDESVC